MLLNKDVLQLHFLAKYTATGLNAFTLPTDSSLQKTQHKVLIRILLRSNLFSVSFIYF